MGPPAPKVQNTTTAPCTSSTTKWRFGNGQSAGTCFYLPHEGRHYLVTAKHLFRPDLNQEVSLWLNQSWRPIQSRIHLHPHDDVDIAAIEMPGVQLPENAVLRTFPNITFSSAEITMSEDAVFLGFPYGIKIDAQLPGPLPLPLIKRGCVSCIQVNAQQIQIGFYLDGHNNIGFSGGPVACAKGNDEWRIFGVVSGYEAENQTLFDAQGGTTT